MKKLTNRQKAMAFDLLMEGKISPLFCIYTSLRKEEQVDWARTIIRRACEEALRIVIYRTGV